MNEFYKGFVFGGCPAVETPGEFHELHRLDVNSRSRFESKVFHFVGKKVNSGPRGLASRGTVELCLYNAVTQKALLLPHTIDLVVSCCVSLKWCLEIHQDHNQSVFISSVFT